MLIGFIGQPNVGKSTFFKAATLADVGIANYPFTTIKANEGVGFVRVKCAELALKESGKLKNMQCKPKHGFCMQGERFVPIKLIDVAGLVPGASEGKGRGNQFLDDLRESDVLIQVIDASGQTDEEGNPTQDHDLAADIVFLEREIDLWIRQILVKSWKTLARKAAVDGNLAIQITNQLSGLKIKEEDVKHAISELNLENDARKWNDLDLFKFAKLVRQKSKPIIIAANKADKPEAKEKIESLKQQFPDILIIPCSAESELALREASKADLISYLPGDNGFEIKQQESLSEQQKKALNNINKTLQIYGSTGIQQCLNEAVFSFLNYIVTYPVESESHFCDSQGNVLPDAILLPSGSTALDLASTIHTDIGKNFVAAIDCKTGKKLGKDSALKDGDVVKIMVK